eukprot:TRINITY_DN1821_c0_g5_i1.p1 TRINITY_DN1821_c0_g5~~TRINITY_DN1821_c0_g5_i1.p1  ORF type:complete len:504 (-),score=62.40 TRINITY_DN1821_c0_g5_i1:316-1827(-)
MIDYRAGVWGFTVAFGWHGSLAPRALTMAIPNALITLLVATMLSQEGQNEFFIGGAGIDDDSARSAQLVMAAFTSIMTFILYNRSNTAYDRWWEGGTLLQKTRGEWFNAFSSIMAFTSTKPEMQAQVDAYVHLLARLMSLLMCCGLQQVSPNRDRPFEIIDLDGIEPESMEFLNTAPDKVEIILQWIQRSMVLHVQTGVLPVAPPILSRAFQEVSRGIVNLQNARKIADFPYPYPLAQVSMILQMVHYVTIPFVASLALPRLWAVLFSFFSIFVLWCIHFNALDLEFPFGGRENDLPMNEMQQEWNKSICTLLKKRAQRPPTFLYEAEIHDDLSIVMSDASALYVPTVPAKTKGVAIIKVSDPHKKRGAVCAKIHHEHPPDSPDAKPEANKSDSKPSQEPAKAATPAKQEGPDIPTNGESTSHSPASKPTQGTSATSTLGSTSGPTPSTQASSPQASPSSTANVVDPAAQGTKNAGDVGAPTAAGGSSTSPPGTHGKDHDLTI